MKSLGDSKPKRLPKIIQKSIEVNSTFKDLFGHPSNMKNHQDQDVNILTSNSMTRVVHNETPRNRARTNDIYLDVLHDL
jgi:hypothetical protein